MVLYLQFLKVSALRFLKNSVGKVEHFAILIINLAIFQNCDIVDLDSHHDFVFLHFQNCDTAHAVDTVGIANTVGTVGTAGTLDTVDTFAFRGKFFLIYLFI